MKPETKLKLKFLRDCIIVIGCLFLILALFNKSAVIRIDLEEMKQELAVVDVPTPTVTPTPGSLPNTWIDDATNPVWRWAPDPYRLITIGIAEPTPTPIVWRHEMDMTYSRLADLESHVAALEDRLRRLERYHRLSSTVPPTDGVKRHEAAE